MGGVIPEVGNSESAKDRIVIRPRALIRFLLALLWFVAGGPSTFACIYMLFHPAFALENPFGLAMNLAIAGTVGFFLFRYITLRGVADRKKVTMRGVLKTVSVPTNRIADVIEHVSTFIPVDGSNTRQDRDWYLIGHDGQPIAKIPSAMMMCQGWLEFYKTLQRFAAINRAEPASPK